MKRVLKTIGAAFIISALVPFITNAQKTGEARVPLTLEGKGPWYSLDLPAKIQLLSKSNGNGDLRILDKTGNEQPYGFVESQTLQQDTAADAVVGLFALRAPSNQPNELSGVVVNRSGDTLSISVDRLRQLEARSDDLLRGYLLDLSRFEGVPRELIFNWKPKDDGFYPFHLEASDDLEHWRPLDGGQFYRLRFNDRTIEKNTIELAEKKVRFIRLLWDKPENPAELLSARVSGSVRNVRTPQLEWSGPLEGQIPVFKKRKLHSSYDQNVRQTANEIHGATDQIFEWQFGAIHPFSAITLEMPKGYTLAPFILYGRFTPNETWREMTRGVFYRLIGEDGEAIVQNRHLFLANAVSGLRLVIDGRGGGIGQEKPSIHLAVPQKTLVFLARGEAPFTLSTAVRGRQSAALAFSTLIPAASGLDDKRISKAIINGEIVRDGAPDDETDNTTDERGFNWKLLPLLGLLVAGVAFLLWAAFRLLSSSDGR